MSGDDDEELIGMYDVIGALEAVIKAAPNAERASLAAAMEGYAECFPEEFHWATGAQAPSLLFQLMMTMDIASNPASPRPSLRLVKPEGVA